MAEAMIGEIRLFPYDFTPRYWLECDGRQLSTRQFAGLFAVIGMQYGGDGKDFFNLPNLQGMASMAAGHGPGLSNYKIGEAAGQETVELKDVSQLPTHAHDLSVQLLGYGQETIAFSTEPKPNISYASRYWYNLAMRPVPSYFGYNPAASPVGSKVSPTRPTVMAAQSLGPTSGQSAPHENRQPFLVLRPCICVEGYFPPHP